MTAGERAWLAMNDVSFHRSRACASRTSRSTVGGEEVGRVRCDGLVVATPAGSTGYNLANGGPVMAWGVEGLAVSFIAPHSLTARALVVAPAGRDLRSRNRSQRGAGRRRDRRPPGVRAAARRALSARASWTSVGTLAQVPGASFYHRLREKFGRLANGT